MSAYIYNDVNLYQLNHLELKWTTSYSPYSKGIDDFTEDEDQLSSKHAAGSVSIHPSDGR